MSDTKQDVIVTGQPVTSPAADVELTEMPWTDMLPNANNERAAVRLRREKEQLTARAATAGPASSARAGSVSNAGDISNGGLGGDFGVSEVIRERGVIEDAAQHEAANRVADTMASAAATAVTSDGWGKPLGQAAADASSLLGDDTRPGLDGSPGNPATATKRARGKATNEADDAGSAG